MSPRWQPEHGWAWLLGRWAVALGAGAVLLVGVLEAEEAPSTGGELAFDPTETREVELDPAEQAELTGLLAGPAPDPLAAAGADGSDDAGDDGDDRDGGDGGEGGDGGDDPDGPASDRGGADDREDDRGAPDDAGDEDAGDEDAGDEDDDTRADAGDDAADEDD